MMKQLHDLQIAYPVSPDKRTDFIPQPKQSKPVTDPSQLPMALNAALHRQAHGRAERQAFELDGQTGRLISHSTPTQPPLATSAMGAANFFTKRSKKRLDLMR